MFMSEEDLKKLYLRANKIRKEGDEELADQIVNATLEALFQIELVRWMDKRFYGEDERWSKNEPEMNDLDSALEEARNDTYHS